MRINKRIPVYALITVLLVFFSLTYAVAAKNIRNRKNTEAEKISENKNNKDKSDAIPSSVASDPAFAQEQIDISQTDIPTSASVSNSTNIETGESEYPVHKNISTTYFWVGEEAGKDNKNISNLPSAWDEDWAKHFGGIDDPGKRSGFCPAKFTPKENSFYFALPYNDFNEKGKQKNDAVALAMWAKGKKFGEEQSMCKNQWIRISKNGKSAFAQWEDVGPFGEDDKAYVFGNSAPKSKENGHAGLDVSPAVHDYLGLSDVDKTDWQFIDAEDVPSGPWKNVITTSQVYWK
jgi:hypothetical protein